MKTIINLILLACAIMFLVVSCNKIQPRKHEVRAVWMSRFEYAQDKTAAQSQAYIKDMFTKFHQAGINLIFFQVRGNADAFYKSEYEPWSQMLSGTLGTDPGWDPLQYALDLAHLYGMELHTWINTFSAWRAEDAAPIISEPLHPLLAHPDWVVCDSLGVPMQPSAGYITFSPGHPEVRQHIQNVVMDLLNKYDVDGVHFDYIRYPEESQKRGYSGDSMSVNLFKNNPEKLSRTVWQREQINMFVSSTYDLITSTKPWVKVSAAVLGNHYSQPWCGFHAVFQDARRWMTMEKIDMICPMTYRGFKHPTAPYPQAIEQWQQMQHLNRYVVPSIGVFKLDTKFTLKEIWRQYAYLYKRNFPGVVFFSAGKLATILDKIKPKYYPKPALVPVFNWKKDVPVVGPEEMNFFTNVQRDTLRWTKNRNTLNMVLYQKGSVPGNPILVDIIPVEQGFYPIPQTKKNRILQITVVNRVGRESKPWQLELD